MASVNPVFTGARVRDASAAVARPPTPVPPRVLTRVQWLELADAHARRVDRITAGHRDRAGRGLKHPVEDFLFEYYSTKPSHLRRWHPGVGVVLQDAPEHGSRRWYATDGTDAWVDALTFWDRRGSTVDFVEGLLRATASRPAQLGCFGLHEWAMVYRADHNRHPLPLRLGQAGTDTVVESHPIACTHFDAYRFFTPPAVPLNATVLTRETQVAQEQPGCLHATMDLYKWCTKLAPAVPSELQQDCFELALEVRQVDMQASPYDVTSLGLAPIAVETPEGKREYARLQRRFAERGAALRERLVAACVAIRVAGCTTE